MRYGITSLDYAALLEGQGGVCAVCNAKPTVQILLVDHCHVSLKVRGLLCQPCNLALGHFGDDPARMRAAAAYLERDVPA